MRVNLWLLCPLPRARGCPPDLRSSVLYHLGFSPLPPSSSLLHRSAAAREAPAPSQTPPPTRREQHAHVHTLSLPTDTPVSGRPPLQSYIRSPQDAPRAAPTTRSHCTLNGTRRTMSSESTCTRNDPHAWRAYLPRGALPAQSSSSVAELSPAARARWRSSRRVAPSRAAPPRARPESRACACRLGRAARWRPSETA
jgi:hypothetical protein